MFFPRLPYDLPDQVLPLPFRLLPKGESVVAAAQLLGPRLLPEQLAARLHAVEHARQHLLFLCHTCTLL